MLLAFEGAGLLDVSGPAEVFAVANAITLGDAYRVVIASPDGRDPVSSSGFRIGVAGAAGDVAGPLDTVMVPGTWTWPEAIGDAALLAAVSDAAARSRRVAGVCVGALILAAAGLLDGRRATTHWQFLDELAGRFPAVRVERGPIFVRDDGVYTSAGVSAGIDLALALVEDDLGAAVARRVARHLVVFMQRPGGQSQFSVRLRAEPPERSPLRALLDAVADDPAGDHRLAALSARAGFSERHLTRVFARELSTTPGRYVEQVRVEAARAMLESSDASLDVIARRCGLGSAETLRRAFARTVGVTPHAYRRRFATTGVAALALDEA
ncbi:GlxA family transcriptional regulator [Miltoncostaea oceani]|uniref:GlxA family transcriptional regulator n=1 Tax=Miltoncostaea oceani TaxID=2843216 RepID=UPI003CCE640E